MSEESGEWRWVDLDGVQKDIDEWDLVASLSSGALPAFTLVWKRGWKQWLPASCVAELETAIPQGKAETPIEPEKGDVAVPPAPPIERYKGYEARDAARRLAGGTTTPGLAPAHAPPPPPRGGGAAIPSALVARAAASPPPPPPAARPPMPTLVEEPEAPTTSATLRPPGAVPPPPRRMPAHAPIPRVPALETPLPQIAIREKSDDDMLAPVVAPPTPVPVVPPPEPPTLPVASPAPIDAPVAEADPLPSWDVETAPPASGLRPVVQAPAPATPSSFPTAMVALGALVGALAALVAVLLVARATHRPQAGGVAGTDSAGAMAPVAKSPVGPCALARPAQRLAADILQSVPPYLALAPDGKRVMVGLAATKTEGVGLIVDPASLTVSRVFDDNGTAPVVGVVPTPSGGKVAFVTDRDDGSLRDARTVDGKSPFMLGLDDDGLVRAEQGHPPVVVWPGGGNEAATEIRVATTPRGEHAVTLRRSGQSGQVLGGWLEENGAKKTDLVRIPSPALVGTPMVAANDDSILIVFAARNDKTELWRVEMAGAKDGALPTETNAFSIPAGGPGKEAMSPAAAGFGSGWVLQWTEGTAGGHDVRIQTLDDKLVPVGDAVTVSPAGANAGQGVVWVHGKTGISLFLVANGHSHELWGAALKCP